MCLNRFWLFFSCLKSLKCFYQLLFLCLRASVGCVWGFTTVTLNHSETSLFFSAFTLSWPSLYLKYIVCLSICVSLVVESSCLLLGLISTFVVFNETPLPSLCLKIAGEVVVNLARFDAVVVLLAQIYYNDIAGCISTKFFSVDASQRVVHNLVNKDTCYNVEILL